MSKLYNSELVSIIIPMFNAEKNIENTIKSVLNQSYKQYEIIVIDDCSKDNSGEIVKKLSKEYSSICYVAQETNQGVAVARNTGLSLARGRYIAFLDSDDLWKSDKLEKQLSYMQKYKAGFVFSAIEMIDQDGNRIKPKRKIKNKVTYKYLLKNTVIPTSSVLIDRTVVGDFEMPLMRSGQDYATWLLILRRGIVAYGLDETLVSYRVSSNSLSSNKFRSIKQVWGIQVHQEKINKLSATFNTCCFVYNALKKYFL